MSSLLYPLLMICCAALLLYAVRLYTTPGVGAVLAEQARPQDGPRKPFFERYILPLVRVLVPVYDFAIPFSDRRKIRQRLAAAGDPCGLSVNDVVQLKVASLLLSLPAGWYFSTTYGLPLSATIVLIIASAAPLFFLPEIIIGEIADKRQGEITTTLPDLMDLLGISITAGVGFDLALQNIVQRFKGPLAEELERMLQEMRLGTPRRNAYRKMIWRNESPALRSFFSALSQADELGTPVADILEWQAQSLRHQRVQIARRKGARASSKVSLVLATVLLMSMVGIIIATLVLNLVYGDNSLFDLLTG
jgi:tight adherence protein C